MADQNFEVLNRIQKKLRDMGDGTHAEVIATVQLDANGNVVGNPADRELLPTRYACKQAFTGAAVGDVIRQTVALDVSGAAMTVISVLWENESAGTTISAPPSVAVHLETIKQGDGLTLAQLLSAGLATANNQLAQIGYLADIADANDPRAPLKYYADEKSGNTLYVLKSAGTRWLMMRRISGATGGVATYAEVVNNPTVTTPAAAWANRASLVYGDLSAA